jgi:hypothetical protein
MYEYILWLPLGFAVTLSDRRPISVHTSRGSFGGLTSADALLMTNTITLGEYQE